MNKHSKVSTLESRIPFEGKPRIGRRLALNCGQHLLSIMIGTDRFRAGNALQSSCYMIRLFFCFFPSVQASYIRGEEA